jgi:hypothetical protein
MGDQPILRPLPILWTTQTQNKLTQIYLPQFGFEPATPAFERVKTVNASYRASIVIAKFVIKLLNCLAT